MSCNFMSVVFSAALQAYSIQFGSRPFPLLRFFQSMSHTERWACLHKNVISTFFERTPPFMLNQCSVKVRVTAANRGV